MKARKGELKMEHDARTGERDDVGVPPDPRQVAWLLREKLNAFIDSDTQVLPGKRLQSLLSIATSHKLVSVDPGRMNPILWRTLPKELLPLVFARLPLRDITRLRCLSTEWERGLATANSDINRACEEARPSMVALLSHSVVSDRYFVSAFDIAQFRKLFHYQFHWQQDLVAKQAFADQRPPTGPYWIDMGESDGGLLCFVPAWRCPRFGPFNIKVMNLLTRVERVLPPLRYVYHGPPAMVRLKVDSASKSYKVMVVCRRNGAVSAEEYDSDTQKWTKAGPACGLMIGFALTWKSYEERYRFCIAARAPCAYDFSERKLQLFTAEHFSSSGFVVSYVFVKDSFFVLHSHEQVDMDATAFERERRKAHSVGEYHFRSHAKDWVQVKSYKCPRFEAPEKRSLHLLGCDGFLMIVVRPWDDDFQGQARWLLDLQTGEWRDCTENSFRGHCISPLVLCKSVWNAIP